MKRLVIEVKQTNELDPDSIFEINQLKNQHWKHTAEEHLKWFNDNIAPNDEHVILRGEGEGLLAYLNLVNINVIINQTSYNMRGIGNVCVSKNREHSGLGTVLMSATNALFKCDKTCGLLLCHDNLKMFYQKTGWKVIDSDVVIIGNKPFQLTVMSYDPFHIIPTKVESLIVDRSF